MKSFALKELTLSITDGKHGDCKNEENSGYYFISCKDIKDGNILYEDARQITKEDFIETHKRTKLECDDILVTNSGTIGRMAFVTDAIKANRTTFQKSVAIIKPNKNIIVPLYLYYAIKSNMDNLAGNANGSAQKNLLLSTMRDFNLTIHSSLSVQRKIASILSAYDDLIENNKKQIKLLEEAAQRLYKEWFVDLRFPGHENVPMVDGVPEGWSIKTLGDIADIVMGQSPKSEFYNQEGEGLPFHQGVGSYGCRFAVDNTFTTSYTRIAQAGSILFSVRAPVGRLNITKNKIVIGRGLAAIKDKRGFQSFLFYMLKERFFKDDIVGNGSIFASISKDELLNQKFILANVALIEKFNNYASELDRKLAGLDKQIQFLVETRDRLLSKLMRGEIEV